MRIPKSRIPKTRSPKTRMPEPRMPEILLQRFRMRIVSRQKIIKRIRLEPFLSNRVAEPRQPDRFVREIFPQKVHATIQIN